MVAFEVPVDDIKVKTKQPKAIPKPKSQDPKRLNKEIDGNTLLYNHVKSA